MLRTFQQHRIRPAQSLDGLWDFALATDAPTSPPPTFDRKMPVPAAWEQCPGLEAYRGTAWYRHPLPACPSDHATRLVFGGVSHTATVYVDGREVGEHHDAFTPWEVLLPGSPTAARELTLQVENRFGAASALHLENDYYTYGGITRPVELQHVPPVYLHHLRATPRQQRRRWSLQVELTLKNWSDRSARRSVTLTIAGQSLTLGPVTVSAGSTRRLRGELQALDVRPWQAEAPTLYDLQAQLFEGQTPVDDLIERVGFRTIQVRGKKLLLSGAALRLRGYNRHEDHPQFGCALPLAAMHHDLMRLRDLGCNFVRTAHYPNDQRFLDLCDEMGFYVWEESHARTTPFDHPRFDAQIRQTTREMIHWHHNHPSILIWGCLNECESHTARGRNVHRQVLGLIRKLDPSRPVTFASNKGQEDLCLGLVDIVSWNLYDAWYSGGLEDIAGNLQGLLRWLHSPKSHGGRGKPVILSEFGAGGIYGYRQPHHAKWTEEYQAQVLDECLRVYLHHPDVVGAAIWQFSDIRVSRDFWLTRPRTMNNKGTFDEFRRPKLCHDMVRRRMREAMAATSKP